MKRLLIIFGMCLLALTGYSQKKSTLMQRKENFIDIRDQLGLYAAIVKKNAAPAPVLWQKVVEARECDELLLLPDGNILFGTINLRSKTKSVIKGALTGHALYALFPNYSTLYKVDIHTGDILWKYERTGQMGTALYSFLDVSDKTLIMQENDEKKEYLLELDLASGKELWKQAIGTNSQCKKIAGNILVFQWADHSFTYTCYTLSGKKQVYTQSLDKVSKEYRLFEFGEGKIAVTDSTACYLIDAASGSLIKKLETAAPYTNIYNATNTLLLISNDGNCCMINDKGQAIWNKSVGHPPLFCSEWDKKIYWTTYNGSATLLSAIDKNSGQQYWSCPLDNPTMSDFAVHDGTLALTTNTSLYFIDMKTGQPAKQIGVPVAKERSLDLIQRRNNRWIVTYETAIECYNNSFEKQWGYDMKNFVKTTATHLAKTNGGKYIFTKNPMSGMADFHMSMISLQQSMSQSYANTLKYGYANPTASQKMENNTSIEQFQRGVQAEKQAATFALASSIATIGASIYFDIMTSKIQAELSKASNLRTLYTYRLACREAEFTNQDDYYIKRFETSKSRNLLIVNLNDGSWEEIVIGPREGSNAEENALLNTCLYVYHPEKDIIICNGIGLDPTKWEPIDINKTITVKSSLLSFKISDLKFKKPGEYAENSLTAKK